MNYLKKYINMTRLAASYYVSRCTAKDTVWGMPYSAGIELTNYCNLKCRHCPTGSGSGARRKGYMDVQLYEKIVGELSQYIVSTMFYFQGESMMHPHFFEMLRMSDKIGPVISTNGHFLDKKSCTQLASANIRKIIVSLDGISDQSYTTYRVNGRLKTVIDGIITLSLELYKRGKGRRLEIQVLVNRYNEGELESILEFAGKLGVRVRFKSMQITGEADTWNFLPRDPRFRRYIYKQGSLVIRSSLPDYCYRLWTNPVITWDGQVLPCCYDKDASYIMGDLKNQSFSEIWQGEKYRTFRRSLLENRSGTDICNNCSEGLEKEIKT